MKNAQLCSILFVTCFLFTTFGWTQSPWTITAISTGKTTGHIATLIIDNQTGKAYTFQLAASIIPSQELSVEKEPSQPMYADSIGPIQIPDGRQTEVPVYGYCLDVYKPPTPAGLPMPAISQWIRPGTVLPGEPFTSSANIQMPVREKMDGDGYLLAVNSLVTLEDGPTSHLPIIGPLDLTNRPEEASSYIFTAVPAIENAFDRLKANGRIQTAFSRNPEQEREAVIQQTIWVYTSRLEQNDYEKGDFSVQLEQQFETQTGEKLPEDKKEVFQQGADQFWSTFTLVGTEAKVIEQITDNPDHITVPPERVPPPEEVDKVCEIDVKESIGDRMDGGLGMLYYGIPDENPSPILSTEMWVGLGDGSIVLCADGYDADQLDWDCKPNKTCPETLSENTASLTSRVKFSWEIVSGEAHFSNNAQSQKGECVILYPSPLEEPSEGSPTATASITLNLTIEDAGYGQPLDPKVEKTVRVDLKQAHDERAEYKISGPLYYRKKGFKLPVPGPVSGLKKGTCKAKGPDWTLDQQLIDPQVLVPKDSLYPEEKVRLVAQDQTDSDKVDLYCESNCKGEEWSKKYPDNVEWKWEILSGEGSLYSKYNVGRSNTAYGRTVVFEAPGVDEAPSTTRIRVTVFNPEALQIEDSKRSEVIKIPTKCWERDYKTSHVTLYWEDLIQDRDWPSDEKIAHVSNALYFTIRPQSCRPKLNDGQEDLTARDRIEKELGENEEIQDALEKGRIEHIDFKFLKPKTKEISVQEDDNYISSVTLLEYDQCVIVFASAFYEDPGLNIYSEEEKEELQRILQEMLTRAQKLGLTDAFYGEGKSGDRLFIFFWFALIYGFEGLEENEEFQELKEVAGAQKFEEMLEKIKEEKKKYDEEHGEGSFEKLFPGANPLFKDLDAGFIFSYWKICGELEYCQDHCTIEVKSNARSYLGNEDHKITRTSSIVVTTPRMIPHSRIASNTRHTEQGEDY